MKEENNYHEKRPRKTLPPATFSGLEGFGAGQSTSANLIERSNPQVIEREKKDPGQKQSYEHGWYNGLEDHFESPMTKKQVVWD